MLCGQIQGLVVIAASVCTELGQIVSDKSNVGDGMNSKDLHTPRRCCQHDMWHGTVLGIEGDRLNGTTEARMTKVTPNFVF